MRLFKLSSVLLIFSLLLVIVGCGKNEGSDASAQGSEKPASTASASSSPEAAPAADEVRVFEHSMGKTEIKGTPKRVVVLEWTYGEDLLALGVQPVGFADIATYKQYVNIEPQLGADVVDVGTRQEPNLETIASLKPDLIILAHFRGQESYPLLSKIAPTLVFNSYPEEGKGDQYQEMVDTFKTIADVLGKKAEAEAVLADLDKVYADSKAKLESAGKTDKPFVLALAYSNQNAVQFRLSTDNSLAVKILEHIGLTNAYKPAKFEVYGFSTTDVEALPPVQDANFIHMIQESDNVIENQLKDNAIWKNLSFVKENRVYALGGDTWPYGGPLSAKIIAGKIVDLLTK
ncbi:ABC transporter substrate-binding protein [Cohnella faecalis]|uniref:Iron-siderophore ABC transporter substrate-binding protein n=1 Tax=Cohnella faecalis TaxID=2315694 RepID=A0A398CEM7_9BACL|nr:iron-siderophore ABC transporter substrate-binding protein [Cohnella faecalis]RIE01080.1 iron-siderophore ABC transporter substrate-binding protein [Cohnella faecalis]